MLRLYDLQLGNANSGVIFQTRIYGFDGIQTRIPGFDMVGHLSAADSQIVYYKQLRGGQTEVWLARYLDDSRRSVPVLQKRQLKQHHMSTTMSMIPNILHFSFLFTSGYC